MNPYLLVTGDFVSTGGMDVGNYSLARYLADQGREVHLVAHRVADELSRHPNVRVHLAPKPLRSYFLGEPLLDRLGRYWAARLEKRGARVLVNGGNCGWKASNWVHYVHAAYEPGSAENLAGRAKRTLAHRRFLINERRALSQARLIITNSARTHSDVARRFPVAPERLRTVYYGIDAERFRPASPSERTASRASLGWPSGRVVLLFTGNMADERKGFNCLFEAWRILCADPSWDADLAIAGSTAALPAWRSRAVTDGILRRIHFLGFRQDMSCVLAACDALVSPARYEAYGFAVHEALCCGLPALVSSSAGVAERYPTGLDPLLIRNPDDAAELAGRLRYWRAHLDACRAGVVEFSRILRARTWGHACAEMVDLIEAA
jgi:glycosyltransferase involved in cell wall biosynthesis